MSFTFENITMIGLVLLTGLSAGLCFTWANAVSPGIGRLDDSSYLLSIQSMNRTILNPLFFIVFFGPFFLAAVNLYVFKDAASSFLWLVGIAMAIYFLGLVLVTIIGNVPLNEILDRTDISSASTEELRSLRDTFEAKWNRFHLIRTVSAITSFVLLLISFTQTIHK